MSESILEKIHDRRQELLREFKPGIYCVIDYCKFSFNIFWSWNEKIVREICRILKIDFQECDNNGFGTECYKTRLVYDEGLDVLTDPHEAQKRMGVENYFIVEMKGSACRYFEQRGGDWKELFTFLSNNNAIMKRIDVACDDMVGILNVEELSRRLKNKCYTTPQFRYNSYKEEFKNVIDRDTCIFDDNDFDIIETRTGWSATLGSKQSCQLQFYDKYAERKAKNIEVFVKNWVRCELRFYEYKAQNVLPILTRSFENENFPLTAMHLLGSVIEIKDDVSQFSDHRNYYKASVWPNWSLFIEGVPRDRKLLVPGRQESFDPETAITSRVAWAERCWPRTLIMLRAAINNDKLFHQLVDELTLMGLEEGKIDNKTIHAINRFAVNELGLPERKKEDIIKGLMQSFNIDPSRFDELMAVGNLVQKKDLRSNQAYKDFDED